MNVKYEKWIRIFNIAKRVSPVIIMEASNYEAQKVILKWVVLDYSSAYAGLRQRRVQTVLFY